jgi:hypothetical protein
LRLEQILDLARGELLARAGEPRRRALGRLVTVVAVVDGAVLEQPAFLAGAQHVGDVEERGALDLGPEIDERGLHPGEDARHLAAIDVSDEPSVALALHEELCQGAFLDDRDADLGALGIHSEHVVHQRLCNSLRLLRSVAT